MENTNRATISANDDPRNQLLCSSTAVRLKKSKKFSQSDRTISVMHMSFASAPIGFRIFFLACALSNVSLSSPHG